jgi:hypothetical protein
MLRFLAVVAAAAIAGSAGTERAAAENFDRLATLRLIESDLLREDSRVFQDRERGEAIEATVAVGGLRYRVALQRPKNHEFLLAIEARDGGRCPGLQILIVGAQTGQLYQGVCQANIALNLRAARAYYEAELDRLLALFHPLLAPHVGLRREGG